MDKEWARGADDMLWRRSKMGLHAGAGAGAALEGWIAAREGGRAKASAQ